MQLAMKSILTEGPLDPCERYEQKSKIIVRNYSFKRVISPEVQLFYSITRWKNLHKRLKNSGASSDDFYTLNEKQFSRQDNLSAVDNNIHMIFIYLLSFIKIYFLRLNMHPLS